MLMNPWARDLFWLPYNIWISSNLQQVGKFADPAAGKTDSVATTEAQLASQNQRRCFKVEGSKAVDWMWLVSLWNCQNGVSSWFEQLEDSNFELLSVACGSESVFFFFFFFGNLEGWFLDVFQDKIWFMMGLWVYGYIFEGRVDN